MIAQLLPLFSPPAVLTALLPLVSDLRTKSDRKYFSAIQHSNALSLLSLSVTTVSVPAPNLAPLSITAPQPRDRSTRHAYQSANEPMAEQAEEQISV